MCIVLCSQHMDMTNVLACPVFAAHANRMPSMNATLRMLFFPTLCMVPFNKCACHSRAGNLYNKTHQIHLATIPTLS